MSVFDDDPRLAQMCEAWRDGFEAGVENIPHRPGVYRPGAYKLQDGTQNMLASEMWRKGYECGKEYARGMQGTTYLDENDLFWYSGHLRRKAVGHDTT